MAATLVRPAVGGPREDGGMIDHFGINCADMERAAAFYDKVLGVLGQRRLMDFGVAIGYGEETPDFWISTFEGIGPNREVHVAFAAADQATARVVGTESLPEPRLWPECHPGYFGAFVRDPDGNNVEAVCHTAAPA